MECEMATATEVKNRFGEYLEKARHQPVIVEKTGRKYAVIVSYEEYERLQAIEDRQWALTAEEARKSGYVGTEETMKVLTRYME